MVCSAARLLVPSKIGLLILCVCEVWNGICSRISIVLTAFQKPDFVTKQIRLVK